MDSELYKNYLDILKQELVPALGCTEPIAIACAAAKARRLLGSFPESLEMKLSGNIIKNVKGVTVPNSGGLKGIDIAAVLGMVGGNADKALEVLEEITPEHIARAKELASRGICTYSLAENVPNLYISAKAVCGGHYAEVVIAHRHTNIIKMEKDGEVLLDRTLETEEKTDDTVDRSRLTVKDILDFADQVRMEDIEEIISRQIRLNTAISQEGLDNNYGAQIGKTLMHVWGKSATTRACARAAAGSDARMGGCSMPVVINSGSGNQGITVSLPVIVYAEEWEVSRDKLYRSLVVSNLIAVHQKYYIGSLSAYCGAVSAACGAGAGITYMYGGTHYHKYPRQCGRNCLRRREAILRGQDRLLRGRRPYGFSSQHTEQKLSARRRPHQGRCGGNHQEHGLYRQSRYEDNRYGDPQCYDRPRQCGSVLLKSNPSRKEPDFYIWFFSLLINPPSFSCFSSPFSTARCPLRNTLSITQPSLNPSKGLLSVL